MSRKFNFKPTSLYSKKSSRDNDQKSSIAFYLNNANFRLLRIKISKFDFSISSKRSDMITFVSRKTDTMPTFENIIHPIASELEKFNFHIEKEISSRNDFLNSISKYNFQTKGKQLRPILVMLSAKLLGEINTRTYTAATFVEIIHSASLIHDDVVDESDKRRGQYSVKALWGNKSAVLVGDYLLSKAMQTLLKHKEYGFLEIAAKTAAEMSEGELLQQDKSYSFDIEESEYFEVITKKTAGMISTCCIFGAMSVDADNKWIECLANYGKYLGITFQIRDDLFDYQHNEKVGKPLGNDIREHKMTLPLIHFLKNCNTMEREKTIHDIKFSNKDPKVVEAIIEKVQKSGGLQYAEGKMNVYAQKALQQIEQLPNSETLQSLKDLVTYCVEREK
jgi:Geranylgeranyl pyrophosphate synthase